MFGEKTSRNFQQHGVIEKVLQGLVRHVTPPFEIGGLENQFRPEKPDFLTSGSNSAAWWQWQCSGQYQAWRKVFADVVSVFFV
ncbi:MAG: hypothetical protein ACRC2T_05410, partial [Thermoguttaceae bacterium]